MMSSPEDSAAAQPIRRLLRPVWEPLARRAARAAVAGTDLTPALAECRVLQTRGFASTIGFWNQDEYPTAEVIAEYRQALEAIRQLHLMSVLSIKPPALGFQRAPIGALAGQASEAGLRLHFDSHSVEGADLAFAMIHTAAMSHTDVGCTIPGRWRRSLTDADWAVARGLTVRVVRGQWADPADPDRDPRAGFLAVIDHLVGRARFVSVATHEPDLAREATLRLLAAGTPCEIELLVGQPARGVLAVARTLGVPVRGYVPYGHGALLYRLSDVIRSGRGMGRLSRDLAGRSYREWLAS
jgi:proline dehydrogenase